MYVFAFVLQPALLLFDDLHGLKCDACPENAFLVDRNDTLAVVLGLPTLVFVLGILVAVVVILVRRWRAATAPLRRVLAPVYLSSGSRSCILVVRTAVAPFSSFGGDALELLSVLALLTVPLSFLAGLLRSRLARSAVAELVDELGDAPVPGRLRDALARALGDPSLELAYWLRDDTFVDLDGRVVALPADGSGRVATVVERSGRASPPSSTTRRFATIPNSLTPPSRRRAWRSRTSACKPIFARASRTCARLVPVSSRPPTPSGAGSSATSTTARSSGWSRCALARARPSASSHPTLRRSSCSSERARSSPTRSAELRELARGIHPPLFTDRGLRAGAPSARKPRLLPVELAGLPDERLPAGRRGGRLLPRGRSADQRRQVRAGIDRERPGRPRERTRARRGQSTTASAERIHTGKRTPGARRPRRGARRAPRRRQPAWRWHAHPGARSPRTHGRARLLAARRPPAGLSPAGRTLTSRARPPVATIVLRQHVDYQQWAGRCRCHAQTSSEDRGLSGRRQFVPARAGRSWPGARHRLTKRAS